MDLTELNQAISLTKAVVWPLFWFLPKKKGGDGPNRGGLRCSKKKINIFFVSFYPKKKEVVDLPVEDFDI